MVAISFQEQFLDALLRGDKQQTTRSQTERFKVGDITQIYIKQRGRITDKPVRQMTGAGTTAMADRVNDPKYYYPQACPVVERSKYSDMPSYYAHFLGKVEITEVYEMYPCDNSSRSAWAKADGFDNFTCADTWFTKQYGHDWYQQIWTVIRWNGWLERYFQPSKVITMKCTYCKKEIADGDGIYLDESGVDGIFCDNGVCAEAYICECAHKVAAERD